jgi:CBS domain-containing protein
MMTTELETVVDSLPMSHACKLMVDKHITGVPVTTETGSLVGVLSWTDVMDALQSDATKALNGTVRDFMTDRIVAVATSATVRDAASVMTRGHVHRVLVVDDDGNLAGLVSAVDIVHHFVATTS